MIVLYFFMIIITLVVWKIFYNKRLNITYIKSDIDDQYYLVRNEGSKVEAANFLAILRKDLISFCIFIKENNKDVSEEKKK